MSWGSGLERANKEIHSFWCLTKARILRAIYVILLNNVVLYRTIHTISTFSGNIQRSNSHKWHPIRQLKDDISAIIGRLKTPRGYVSNPPEGSSDLCNKNKGKGRGFEIFFLQFAT
jgi:hypothetical protein